MTQNPYETPRYESPRYESEGQVLPELTYYRAVTTKLTVCEFWNLSKNWPELIVGLTLKFLRVPLPTTHAIAEQQCFRRIDASQVSEPARQSLEPVVEEALALGMQYGFTYAFVTLGTIEAVAVALQSEDGCVLMSILYIRHWTALAVDERVLRRVRVDTRRWQRIGHGRPQAGARAPAEL